jgi:hypothetical protein
LAQPQPSIYVPVRPAVQRNSPNGFHLHPTIHKDDFAGPRKPVGIGSALFAWLYGSAHRRVVKKAPHISVLLPSASVKVTV